MNYLRNPSSRWSCQDLALPRVKKNHRILRNRWCCQPFFTDSVLFHWGLLNPSGISSMSFKSITFNQIQCKSILFNSINMFSISFYVWSGPLQFNCVLMFHDDDLIEYSFCPQCYHSFCRLSSSMGRRVPAIALTISEEHKTKKQKKHGTNKQVNKQTTHHTNKQINKQPTNQTNNHTIIEQVRQSSKLTN